MRALPPETLGDTLLLANDLAPVASPLHERPGATTQPVGRHHRLRHRRRHACNSILDESAEEVRSLTRRPAVSVTPSGQKNARYESGPSPKLGMS